MTERKPSLFWPIGPVPVVLPAMVIAGVVYAMTRPMLAWPYQEWIQTSAEFHQQNAFAAPIAAAAATYFAGRLTPPDRIFALPTAARAGYPVAVRHLLVLNISFLVGYLTGFAPLVAATVRDAEYGGPAPLVVLTGLLGLIAATVIGYFVGVVARTSLFAPASLLLLFTATVLGTGGDTFSALTPVIHLRPTLGSTETLPFVGYRIAFLTATTIAVSCVVVTLLKHHKSYVRLPRATTLLPLLLPLTMMIPPLINKPALFGYDFDLPKVCKTQRNIEYCVHEGHRSRLDLIVESSDAVLALYGAPVPQIEAVYDVALRGSALDEISDWQSVQRNIVWIPIHPRTPVEVEATDLIVAVSGLRACTGKAISQDGTSYSENAQLADDLRGWLKYRGAAPEKYPFHGVALDVMRGWIAQKQELIATCSLTQKDLPN